MSTGWNEPKPATQLKHIINLLGNEYWLELSIWLVRVVADYKPTGK